MLKQVSNPLTNPLTKTISNPLNPLTKTITNTLTKTITNSTSNSTSNSTPNKSCDTENENTPFLNVNQVMQQLNALTQKTDSIINLTKNTYDTSTLTQERSKRTTMQLVDDLATKLFDPNKEYGTLYITGKIILSLVLGLPLTIFNVLMTLITIIFYVILFLMIFIPLLLIGIAFFILIFVLIKVYTLGKKASDVFIQVLNSIIPPPLKGWNGFANGINSVVRKFGVKKKIVPTVRNPNSYKIKKGVSSIYDIIGLVTKPMKESANRNFEKALD